MEERGKGGTSTEGSGDRTLSQARRDSFGSPATTAWPMTPPGQAAGAVADFNGAGSLDLAVAFADGAVCCYYNDAFNCPRLRVTLAPGGQRR